VRVLLDTHAMYGYIERALGEDPGKSRSSTSPGPCEEVDRDQDLLLILVTGGVLNDLQDSFLGLSFFFGRQKGVIKES
jgi:hypothetical protein